MQVKFKLLDRNNFGDVTFNITSVKGYVKGVTTKRQVVLALLRATKEAVLRANEKAEKRGDCDLYIYDYGICNALGDALGLGMEFGLNTFDRQQVKNMPDARFREHHLFGESPDYPIGGEREYDREWSDEYAESGIPLRYVGKSGRKRVMYINSIYNWVSKHYDGKFDWEVNNNSKEQV